MEKLSLTIENELAILERYKLTAEEWLIIRLLFLASEEERKQDYLLRYLSYRTDLSFSSIISSLQEKEIILKSYKIRKGEAFKPEDIPFNKVFLNNYFKYSLELGIDLFKHYPVSMIVNGVTHSMRGTQGKYRDLDDMFLAYGKAIRNNPITHKEVIELLEWGKENNLVNTGMAEFIASKGWISLRDMKEGDAVVVNMDNVTTL